MHINPQEYWFIDINVTCFWFIRQLKGCHGIVD